METWIHDEILDGLSKLMCLSLDRTPAADMIAGTAMAWGDALTDGRVWDQQLDAPRFRKAFTKLAQTRQAWPAPAHFLEAMPPREQLALTKQPITSAPDSPQVRAMLDRIGKMLRIPG